MTQPNGKNYLIKTRSGNLYFIGDIYGNFGYTFLKSVAAALIITEERPEYGTHTFDEAKAVIRKFKNPENYCIEFIEIGHPEIFSSVDLERFKDLEDQFS
jgi:hypothetical protein